MKQTYKRRSQMLVIKNLRLHEGCVKIVKFTLINQKSRTRFLLFYRRGSDTTQYFNLSL